MKTVSVLSSSQGFTLIEVLLSSFILTVGLVTIMSLFSASHRQSLDARNIIIATNLAQEGAEIARNIRDNNLAFRLRNWTTGANCSAYTTPPFPSGACDPFNNFPNGANRRCTASYGDTGFNCSNPSFVLGLDGSGLYQHGAGVAGSRFSRVLRIDHLGGSSDTRIQSFVLWQAASALPNGSGANGAVSWCTPANKCVYTELFLNSWK